MIKDFIKLIAILKANQKEGLLALKCLQTKKLGLA